MILEGIENIPKIKSLATIFWRYALSLDNIILIRWVIKFINISITPST